MVRPIRVEYTNAVYHVRARGNERKAIYRDDADRQRFLETVAQCVERFGVVIHSYCLMANHYHLLLQAPRPKLSAVIAMGAAFTASSSDWRKKPNGDRTLPRHLKALAEEVSNVKSCPPIQFLSSFLLRSRGDKPILRAGESH